MNITTPYHRSLLPGAEDITMKRMLDKFSVEEAIKIAYIPIILSKAAFRFARMAVDECVSRKLPYRKQVRQIRDSIDGYEREAFETVKPEVLEALTRQVEGFFYAAGHDVQTLWFVINSELKKRYPDLGDYVLLTHSYVVISILDYIREFEIESDRVIRGRLPMHYVSVRNRHLKGLRDACMAIADVHKLDNTDMLRLAMRCIAVKVDGMVVTVTGGSE